MTPLRKCAYSVVGWFPLKHSSSTLRNVRGILRIVYNTNMTSVYKLCSCILYPNSNVLHATTVEASSYYQPNVYDENKQQTARAGDGWQQPSSLSGGQQQQSRQLLPSQEESAIEQTTIWIADSPLSPAVRIPNKRTISVALICGMEMRYKAK